MRHLVRENKFHRAHYCYSVDYCQRHFTVKLGSKRRVTVEVNAAEYINRVYLAFYSGTLRRKDIIF